MSHRQLYELFPLMQSGLLRSAHCGGLSSSYRHFNAVARAFANAKNPLFDYVEPWRRRSLPVPDALFPYSAFGSASRMLHEMEEDMATMMQLISPASARSQTAVASAAEPVRVVFDVKQDDSSFIFEAKVPGLKKDDIKVKLTKEKVLVISGQQRSTQENTQEGHTYVHRTSSTFSRRYQLPDNIDADSIAAKFQDGLLTLTVPKTAVPEISDQEIHIHNVAPEETAAVAEAASEAAAADSAADVSAGEVSQPAAAAVANQEMATDDKKADTAAEAQSTQNQPSSI